MPPAELLGLMRGTAPVSAGASAELERLIAAFETDARRARAARVRRRPRPGARRAARARRRGRRGGVRVPRPRRVPPARRLRHLRAATRSSCRTRCCARSGSPWPARDLEGADVEAAHRRHPRQGARGAPGRVRRAARRGTADLPAARRARRLQRHLGVRPHAPGGARGRSPRRRAGADPRAGAPRRRRLRRDVRAGRGTGGPSADELAARATERTSRDPKDAPRSLGPTRRHRRRTRPACRPAWRG